MINQELLSKVLGFHVESIELKKGVDLDLDNLNAEYVCALGKKQEGYGSYSVYNGVMTINIHELAHKCKEWSWENNYSVLVDKMGKDDWHVELEELIRGDECYSKDEYHTSEPEAIFRACEWIMNENKA